MPYRSMNFPWTGAFALLGLLLPLLLVAPLHATPGPTTNWVEAPSEQAISNTNGEQPPSSTEQSPNPEARDWLVQQREPNPWEKSESSSFPVDGMTILAFILLLAIAGTALWMKRRRQQLHGGPEAEAQSRLAVLSSTRLGPKSYAVSVTAGGRVMLLGVTEQTVNHLAWLDEPADEVQLAPTPHFEPMMGRPEAHALADHDLPDDYPGSALRAAAATNNAHLANSQDLARFQKVLQSVHPQSIPASSPAPSASPASQLAARTRDVLGAPGEAAADVAPVLSLRRKRQRRRAAASRTPVAPRAGATTPPFEGQVAGLEALRSR